MRRLEEYLSADFGVTEKAFDGVFLYLVGKFLSFLTSHAQNVALAVI